MQLPAGRFQLSLRSDLVIDEADERLHAVQDGLKRELNR